MSTEYSADETVDARDLAVLADLARVLDTLDPMPVGIVDRTLFALTLDRLHTEVMDLVRLEAPLAAVRGGQTVHARTITFTSEQVTAMITLSVSPSGAVRVDGWVAPATRFDIELHRPDCVLHAQSDDDGAFVLPDVPAGPAGLVLRRADGTGPAVSTPVIEL